ncbi:flavin reductase family protein [Paenibacillus sp. sgz500958]|uniref:flavin reductase family protein n=1 Tax=Paenibacillus sp. sgz500958 TaxID=3242475 RepID=UPI0036D358DB
MDKVAVNYEKMYYGFPVVLVSFYDTNGIPNVTTISSTYTLKDMMVLGFNSKGYAINQIKEVQDFVINVPDRSLMEAISYCGATSGYDGSKFDHLSLTPVIAPSVNAPLIQECPISIECTLTEVIERDHFQGITNILAQIKSRYVAKDYLDHDGRLQASQFDHVLYIGDGKVRGFRTLQESK